MADAEDPVARARALLEATHVFPGPFEFRVVGEPRIRELVPAAVEATLGPDSVLDRSERPSATGKWLAVHVRAHVHSPDGVLATFAALREVPGVRAVL